MLQHSVSLVRVMLNDRIHYVEIFQNKIFDKFSNLVMNQCWEKHTNDISAGKLYFRLVFKNGVANGVFIHTNNWVINLPNFL